ncbi:MAG: hypothetical protein DRG83_10470 [Deltaproteobacteria bacterium]|nr:MAG: hypothetical protein DRG83_10470 [Deltaproteobacteria bacterium]
MELNAILYQGLVQLNRQSDGELGDRSTYVGSSDVADCPRKVVLEKLQQSQPDLSTLIRYARGHLVEEFLLAGLKAMSQARFSWKYQVEVEHKSQPFKAHVDFLFEAGDVIGVLEVKSTSGIPREPYEGWLEQLHFQMGLVKERSPEKKVRGAIFAMDLGEATVKIFEGFEYNSMIYENLLLKAKHIWDCLSDPTLRPRTEKGHLCAWCRYRPDCPAFDSAGIPELPAKEEFQEFLGLKEQRKNINSELEKLTEFFKTGISNTNPDEKKIRVGETVLLLSTRCSKRISPRLKEDHPEIYAKYVTETPYEVLVVQN